MIRLTNAWPSIEFNLSSIEQGIAAGPDGFESWTVSSSSSSLLIETTSGGGVRPEKYLICWFILEIEITLYYVDAGKK